jgi:hypothetical protein
MAKSENQLLERKHTKTAPIKKVKKLKSKPLADDAI